MSSISGRAGQRDCFFKVTPRECGAYSMRGEIQ